MTNRKIYLKDIKRVKSLRSSGNVSLSIITLLGFNRPSLADRGERKKLPVIVRLKITKSQFLPRFSKT